MPLSYSGSDLSFSSKINGYNTGLRCLAKQSNERAMKAAVFSIVRQLVDIWQSSDETWKIQELINVSEEVGLIKFYFNSLNMELGIEAMSDLDNILLEYRMLEMERLEASVNPGVNLQNEHPNNHPNNHKDACLINNLC